jgi:hypothetical protein
MNMELVDRARERLYGLPVDKKALECSRCGSEAPRCEMYNSWCGNKADWSIWVPITWKPPLRQAPKFACNECRQRFNEAWAKPIPGIDRPAHADNDWRPSLLDSIRLAEIAMAFERRNERPIERAVEPPMSTDSWARYWAWYERDYTPAQRENAAAWRKGIAMLRQNGGGFQ